VRLAPKVSLQRLSDESHEARGEGQIETPLLLEEGTQVFAVGQQIDRIAGRSPEQHLDEERGAEERQREPSGAEPDLDREARYRAVAREVAGRLDSPRSLHLPVPHPREEVETGGSRRPAP
jgi:hypothetical protein